MMAVSGLDGHGYIDTAFLGPEWHIERTVPASDVYTDAESAIWDLCPGCVDERGWLECIDEHGDICPWMDEAQEYDGKPVVDCWVGPNGQHFTQCHYRRELWLQDEPEVPVLEGQMALDL